MELHTTSPISAARVRATSRRLAGLVLSLLTAAACTPTELEEVTSESWVGDVGATNMMMMMTIAHRGATVSGSGGFTALLVPGNAQSYTITGMRRADTLDLVLQRTGEQVHFVGTYSYTGGKSPPNGMCSPARFDCFLTGTIAGGDYYGTTVILRRQ